jgi:metal-dependent hydrolase (beta-lactamase superfamily II)
LAERFRNAQGFKGQNGLSNFISTEEDILLDIGGTLNGLG